MWECVIPSVIYNSVTPLSHLMVSYSVSLLWFKGGSGHAIHEQQQACEMLVKQCFNRRVQCKNFQVGIAATESSSGRVLGFATLRECTLESPVYVVENVCVRAGYRRQGIATSMLSRIAGLNLPTVLYIDKNQDHKWLLSFYKKNGYNEVVSHTFLPVREDSESLLVHAPQDPLHSNYLPGEWHADCVP